MPYIRKKHLAPVTFAYSAKTAVSKSSLILYMKKGLGELEIIHLLH